MGDRACYCNAAPGQHCDAPDFCSRCQPCESKINYLQEALRKMHDAAKAYWDGDDPDGGPLIKTLAETKQLLSWLPQKEIV